MAEFGPYLEAAVTNFRDRIFEDPTEVLDPAGEQAIHHEFVSGNHGRKLDFDKIETDSDFYIEWVSVYARVIRATYQDEMPDALVGIANGANRLAKSIADLLGGKILGLETEKLDAKTVKLTDEAAEAVRSANVTYALTVEDVGTTGGTTATAVKDLWSRGVALVESVNTFQRNISLPKLDELGVTYGAVILEPLPMFSENECKTNPEGYCAQGVKLIPHEK